MTKPSLATPRRLDAAGSVVFSYALFASLWVLLSDAALSALVHDRSILITAGVFKGWCFVALTSAILYFLFRRQLRLTEAAAERECQARRESERDRQFLKVIIDGSADAIFAKDLDGRHLLFNHQASHIIGRKPEEVIGLDDKAIFPPDLADKIRGHDRRVIDEDRVIAFEENIETGFGHRVYHTLKGPLRDGNGQLIGIYGIARDITEQKAAEARLAQALAAAEAASRAKGEFLAHMSHEIRTPVNAIVGAARLLELERLTKRQQGYTAIMQHSSKLLLALIDDILNLSKIEAGHIELREQAFDLAEVVQSITNAANVSTQNKNISLSSDIDPDLPKWLLGDPLRLEQILNNLMSNAVKFTAEGSISLSVRALPSDACHARLQFEVADTGIGIAPEKLDAIFEPFAQAEDYITRTHGGTGLGLAICRQLVEMMGGEISVDSTPGAGSRFRFTACFGEPNAGQIPEPVNIRRRRMRKGQLTGCRVLVVEDNEFNRHVLFGMLSHFGVEADAAFDGQDGIECFRVGGPYDAILMDLHLPVLDGLQCTRAIRALPEGQSVPIIALTANILPTTRAACEAAGMNDLMIKPVEPETLERALSHWIHGDSPEGERAADGAAAQPADRIPDDLPGIDRTSASNWSGGSARRLIELLDRMLTHTGDDPDKLARHLAERNEDAAAQITHDLMAAAATVGGTPLLGLAKEINRDIRNGRLAEAESTLPRLREEFSRLHAALAKLQAQCPETQSGQA